MRQELQERGGKTALIVIDVQNGVVADGHEADAVVGRIGQLIAYARTCDIPVVYVQHESDELVPDSETWQIRPEIAPASGDPVVAKRYGDAFMETNFEEVLGKLGIGHLVVTGAQTDACVRATYTGALRDGYDVTLVSDAHTTSDWEYGGVQSKAAEVIARFNVEAAFYDYPNAKRTVATTDTVLTW
jgi:nicotinamidase-related amidase